ncbi:mechanosensitive ion channel family protein [Occallatibacter savannae]|uniref:mechanosensitive ion channel family protein n=1 Tax=Occallatibacter savannae TaxID=1002691 RepID=UPI000D68F2D3|nr:mechanosensitive ion channel family protein [Occallatibacter savannae]
MAIPQIASSAGQKLRARVFGSTRLTILLTLIVIFGACLVFTWETGDVMSNLSFLNPRNNPNRTSGTKKAIVDTKPWQTAQALAALAYTAEEKEYAQEAERLADHEVDQAFASALRQATLDAQHLTLSGDALAMSKKVAQLEQLIAQDKEEIQTITEALKAPLPKNGKPAEYDEGDLEVAKAQLGLDTDELADVQHDFTQASGDQTSQIQAELATHEAAMRGYDKQVREGGQIATVSARRFGTLAGRVGAWQRLRTRTTLLQEAVDQTRRDIGILSAQQRSIESKISAMGAVQTNDLDEKLQGLRDRTALRQILSITDDRIQTEQQLVNVYSKWVAQVLLQRRIIVHLLVQSLALIAFIGICMVVADGLVRRVMAKPGLDNRRSDTLRSILELSIQALGVVLILIVIFGPPKETPTILGLTTAALTIALQDFIIAFLGWFVLIGRNGIHVGDWVEINGVGGEVTDVRLFSTTLLETGTLADRGLPTGRRITFMNGFAIRGTYFNFSTSGQWMWDEIKISLPPSDNVQQVLAEIQKAVDAETQKNASQAEAEWKRGARGSSLSRFTATSVESLRPSGSGIDVLVRYVTRASERFDLRNRLYQRLIEVLREPGAGSGAAVVTTKS